MRLRSMLAVPTVVIILVTCVLVATLSVQALHDWRRGEEGRHFQLVLRQLFDLQETLALERAPTNTAVSAADPIQAELLAAVAAARAKTDAQLRALASVPDLPRGAASSLVDLWSQLHATRARADALLRLPADARGAVVASTLVNAMMQWSETIFPAVEEVLEAAVAANATSDPLLTAARAASDLRYYAGSISGWLTISLSRHQPLSFEMINHVHILQGEVSALHRELLANIQSAYVEEQTREALMIVERAYFGEAQRLVSTIVNTEASTGEFDLTRVDFLRHYRPAMTSLVQLRDQLMDLAGWDLEKAQRARLQRLAITTVVGGLVVLTVVAALLALHRRVIRPLSELAAMVIRLARGDRSVRLPVRHGSREIAELAGAIEVLRAATLAADAEAERRRGELQRWTDQLQGVLAILDRLHDRIATMTTLLPTLLSQLDALAIQAGEPVPGLVRAITATRAGITVVQSAAVRLDVTLRRLHAVGEGEGGRIEDLRGAMEEVTRVVAAIEASVNGLPQITLLAMQALPRPTAHGAGLATLDGILSHVQEMAAAAGGLHTTLLQAHQGIGELARLRA